jgi:Domain of unknown function (DUF5122) beta-propeller
LTRKILYKVWARKTPRLPAGVGLLAALGGTSAPSRAANGDLERSFGGYGTNGRVIGDPFPGTFIADTITLPDDKLLVVGSSGQDFVVARYDASGKLDTSLHGNGRLRFSFAGSGCPFGLASRPGRIAVVGHTHNTPPPSLTICLTILRWRYMKVSLIRHRHPRPRPAHRLATSGYIYRWCGAERHVRERAYVLCTRAHMIFSHASSGCCANETAWLGRLLHNSVSTKFKENFTRKPQ